VIAQQVAGAGAEAGGPVAGVRQAAVGQRQAAAADAVVELVPQGRQQGDALVQQRPPPGRQLPPLRPRRAGVGRQGAEGVADLVDA